MLDKKQIYWMLVIVFLVCAVLLIYQYVRCKTKDSGLTKSGNKKSEKIKKPILNSRNSVEYKTTVPQKIVSEQKGEIVNVMEKLQNLQKEVGMYLIKQTNADPGMVKSLYLGSFGCTPESIAIKLNNIPPNRMMYFTLDGKTIQEPIMYMYNKDKKLFQDLDKSGILDFLGKIIGFTTWGSVANIKNYKKLEDFTNCMKNISFNNIELWKYIGDDQQSQFLNCI